MVLVHEKSLKLPRLPEPPALAWSRGLVVSVSPCNSSKNGAPYRRNLRQKRPPCRIFFSLNDFLLAKKIKHQGFETEDLCDTSCRPRCSTSWLSDQMLTLVICRPCHFRNARLPQVFWKQQLKNIGFKKSHAHRFIGNLRVPPPNANPPSNWDLIRSY